MVTPTAPTLLTLEELSIIARERSLPSAPVRKKWERQQDCHELSHARLSVKDLPIHCQDAGLVRCYSATPQAAN
jgi:hypothetical protein